MPLNVHRDNAGAIARRLAEIRAAVRPDSPQLASFRDDVARIAVEDNADKLAKGIDKDGRPLAPLAASTERGRRGSGGPLAPKGAASSTVTNFFARWERAGDAWRLVTGWSGIDWIRYHLAGAPRGSKPGQPSWSLPRRDVDGISPAGMAKVRDAFKDLARSILNKGG